MTGNLQNTCSKEHRYPHLLSGGDVPAEPPDSPIGQGENCQVRHQVDKGAREVVGSNIDSAVSRSIVQDVPDLLSREALENLSEGAHDVEDGVAPDHELNHPPHPIAARRAEEVYPVDEDGGFEADHTGGIYDGGDMDILCI